MKNFKELREAKDFNKKKELSDLKKLDKMLDSAYKLMNKLQYGKSLYMMQTHDGIVKARRGLDDYVFDINQGKLDGPLER